MLLVGIMIPNGFKRTIGCTTNKRVRAVLVRVIPGVKLSLCHIGRIESSTRQAVSITIYE